MAFNSTIAGAKRKAPLRAVSPALASSILSESQALWVLFNPADRMDVLSLSTNNPLTTTEEEFGQEEQESSDQEKPQHTECGDDVSDADGALDHLAASLSTRINEWQRATEAEVSDNMASWDLDAALVEQILDRSLLRRVPAFYGDLYFDGFSQDEYARFKRASERLKGSLTRKGNNNNDPALLKRLLELLHWQRLLKSLGSLVADYVVNTVARTSTAQPFHHVDYSDSASSSLVMCGPSSWNDL